jgi:hypothetical protein
MESKFKVIVNAQTETDRFKWDFKDVVSRMFVDNGWKVGKRMINDLGMQLQFEAYGGPFDEVECTALADLPMGEFWTHRGWVDPNIGAAARAAGKHLVGAEAFTGSPGLSQYTEDPAFLMQTLNTAYASGVNRLILHTWVHQPFDDKYQPGMGMGWWGTHFSRFQTWSEPGKAFFKYLSRSQALLQYGEQVVDYLCLGGANGYNTDAIAVRDFFSQDINIRDGQIILPSGRAYPFLKLSGEQNIDIEVLLKIAALVKKGAVVVGRPPTGSLGLYNWKANDSAVNALSAQMWNGKPVSNYGKGKIYQDLNQALLELTAKDFEVIHADSAAAIRVVHRTGTLGEIYHISNNQNRVEHFDLFLKQSGMQPEFWQAENGSMVKVENWKPVKNGLQMPVILNAYQSVFVVFRKKNSDKTPVNTPDSDQLLALQSAAKKHEEIISGSWSVLMKPKLDSAFSVSMDNLKDFGASTDNRVRYFSGTATYKKQIVFTKDNVADKQKVMLDLGMLHDIVQVTLDGNDLGVKWYPPYQYDITSFISKGQHDLSISVTNNWANRLIGDEQEPADFEWGADRKDFGNAGRPMKSFPEWFIKNEPRPSQGRKAFTLWYYYKPESQTKPAGLLGPVKIMYTNQ